MPKGGAADPQDGEKCPRFPLTEVKQVLRLAKIGERVVARTMQDYPLDPPKVEKFILDTIRALTEEDFSEVRPQQYETCTVDADVYGVRNKEGTWYVKFRMLHGQVIVLSCHRPEQPIRLASGRTIF